MSLNKVDLNLFLVFDAIYQQRNLTRAAEVLFMSQPAVSNALNRLRSSLNDKLFVRSPGGVSPTPMAENIIDQVQEALKLLDASVTEGVVFDPKSSNKVFRLSMSDLAQSMLLPELLSQINDQAPNVGLECYYIARDQLEKELASGAIDLALDVTTVLGPQTRMQPLMKERYICAVRPDHPDIGETITLDQYLKFDHVQVSSRRTGAGFEDVALQRLGRQRRVKVRVPHFQVAPQLILNSDMVLTVPKKLAQQHNLKVLELPFSLAAIDWNIYWHKSAEQDQTNLWIRNQIQQVVGQQQGDIN
ncbi:MAG: LysR family transcriptional regulator [Candidatus Pelagadaptatus aseana]|uniref:LysR family transcriptional regulator n=1 Tax=Candidatus Pelagadaptatus aseana TaxID=3120508 RepID=UPI0039B24C32